MVMSQQGQAFHITDPFVRETTGYRWFPLTKG